MMPADQKSIQDNQRHRFSSSNLDERSIATDEPHSNIGERQKSQNLGRVGGGPMQSVKNSSNKISQNKLVNNLKMRH
jgi:hypothetical protein